MGKIRKPVKAKLKDKTHTKTGARNLRVVDGYENFVSRVGIGAGQPNTLSKGFYTFNELTKNRIQLEAAYRGSWVVGAVCDSIATDMTRGGIDISSSDAAENVKQLNTGMSRLGIWNSLADGTRWGRLYGGAIGVMQIEGQDPSTELDFETISKDQFKGIAVYDRWQLQVDIQEIIDSGPDIGLPEYYSIISSQDIVNSLAKQVPHGNLKGFIRVHHSRVIRFIGIPLPYYQALNEMLWGESIIERLLDRLISFDEATMSAANLIQKAYLRTVKIKNFREIVGNGGPIMEGMIKSFETMAQLQVSEGLTILDMEDEYQSTAYSFAGLPETLIQFGQQIAGATGIPLVRLFGQSPKGMNSTGESDLRMYYDNINALQESRLRAAVEKVLKALHRSMFGDALPTDCEFEFTPLWQMSAKEKSEVGKNATESVLGAYADGTINIATAMKELRQNSKETGLFTNITDEDIEKAEQMSEDPPLPPVATNPITAKPAKAAGVSKTQVGKQAAGPESEPNSPAAQKQAQQSANYSGGDKKRKWFRRK